MAAAVVVFPLIRLPAPTAQYCGVLSWHLFTLGSNRLKLPFEKTASELEPGHAAGADDFALFLYRHKKAREKRA